jgi:RND family efflux transporter MFP subunit
VGTVAPIPDVVTNGDGQIKPVAHAPDEHEIPKDLPKPGIISLIIGAVVLLLLLAAMFLIGYFPHERATKETTADATARAAVVPIVAVQRPKEISQEKDFYVPANVKAFAETSVYSQAIGYLKKNYVDIQDHVKEGQLLAEIATPEVDAQLDQSKATLAQGKAAVVTAQSNLDLAKLTLDRYEAAQKETPGSISATDLDTKKAAYDQAVAALAQANANVTADQADVDRLTVLVGFEKVYAPFSGTVTARNYDAGAYLTSGNIGAGKELFRITQSDTLRVFANVPQIYVTGITSGQPAYLKVSNYPSREFEGIVARAAGALDPSTRTMLYELDFPNPKGELYAGMYGTARVAISAGRKVLEIPSSALVLNSDGLQVALVREGSVHFQKINPGRDFGVTIEVDSGLEANDQLVVNPTEHLTEGLKVKTIEQDDQSAQQEKPGAENRTPAKSPA